MSPLFQFASTEGVQISLLPTAVYGVWGVPQVDGSVIARIVTRPGKEWTSTEDVADLIARWEAALNALPPSA